MIEKIKIITNNSLSKECLEKKFIVEYINGGLMDVMIAVRDHIHKGHRLLTHPLMGSIKPNETPFKTVAITEKAEDGVDFDSLMLIENSIETSERLIRNKPMRNHREQVIEDFKVIDYDLIKNAIIR